MIFESMPNLPDDLAKLSDQELNSLCEKLRERLIDVVSKNGGHLASNLGVVELTVALYSVYNPHVDRIVWDVGHQSYVHKILTGRDDSFENIRRAGGISGFPKRNESDADCFNTGHSSTSISAALGLARGYKLCGDNRNVVAIIGDGALTGGMAYEAMNDAAQSKTNIKVVLNDNGMSIDKNVGGMSKYLGKIRHRHSYLKAKKDIREFLVKVPLIGQPIVKAIIKFKTRFRHIVVEGQFFEDLGFYYLGPIDGHDIYAMKMALERANQLEGPVLVHIQTKKGKGYGPAENEPGYFHGISNFNPETGVVIKNDSISMSKVFANKVCEIAGKDSKVVAITAAMSKGTGLSEFAEKYPERFFDVGIAEEHAVTMAAGLSASGMKPVVDIYSTFLQRAYDQLLHDVVLQKLPLIVALDRAGVSGYDGETHHGIYDFAYLGSMPRTTVFAPSCKETLERFVDMAFKVYDGAYPDTSLIAIRYPALERFEQSDNPKYIDSDFEFGSGRVVFDNTEGANDYYLIISIGEELNDAFLSALELEKQGKKAIVYDALFLNSKKPEEIVSLAQKAKRVVTVEDAVKCGGFGERIKLMVGNEKVVCVGLENEIIESDKLTSQLEKNGVSVNGILKACDLTNI